MTFKKSIFIVATIIVICGFTYWYFYRYSWRVAIENSDNWYYSFQKKEGLDLTNVKWQENTGNIKIEEHQTNLNLLFQQTFIVNKPYKITKAILSYNHKYSAKVYINGFDCGYIDRNLIAPQINKSGEIVINEYWRPRSFEINKDLLSKAIIKGQNTITIVAQNLQEITSFETHNKQLSFLVKGKNNDYESAFKIEKSKAVFSSSSLPVFYINTNKQVIPDEPKIKATLNVRNPIQNPKEFFHIKIERRGTTSQTFSKKSYSLNLCDSNYSKLYSSLLSLPKARKWVLYGPYADKSLIRNALAYSLHSQMGYYAPRFQFIDLVVNQNYRGIYQLVEKIEISEQRLNIPKLKINSGDTSKATGGYLLQIDRSPIVANYPPKEDTVARPVHYEFYDPKPNKINTSIKNVIKDQYNKFEEKLYYNDDKKYHYLDINSFVDYLIITEVSRNIDGYRLSTFLHNKDINSAKPKFYLEPVWDYNFAFGLTDYHDGYKTEGYVYNIDKYVPFWWHILLKDTTFTKHLKNRYAELRKSVLSTNNIINQIDSLSNLCQPSLDNNFAKWTVLNSSEFWPNYFLGKTYEEEINYLKEWIKKRLEFLDNDILAKKGKTVLYYEVAIWNNNDWFNDVKEKANKNNITLNEMVKRDARYMASQKKNKQGHD